MVIAEQGRARCTIVTAGGAPDAVRFAAAELQRYLKRISGAEIPIQAAGKAPAAPCIGQGLRYTELTVAAVEAARKLEAAGVRLFPRKQALEDFRQAQRREDVGKLLAAALDAWQQRDRFVEQLKDDYVVAYFWVKYNEVTREFNPLPQLKEMSR